MALGRNKPIVCPVLIGRAADLTALYVLVDQAKRGEGQVALISGEAGIGKSRLVAEAKAYAVSQGFFSLQGNCFQTDSAFPYAPFLDLLRSYFSSSSLVTGHHDLAPFAQELSQFLPDVTPLIPESTPLVVPSAPDPQQEKRRLFALLLHFFTRQTTHQPLLFIVEDLHWSDDTSLELLLYLARGCRHLPILFVLTYRSDEVSPELRHCLAELDREHLAQCAGCRLSAYEAVERSGQAGVKAVGCGGKALRPRVSLLRRRSLVKGCGVWTTRRRTGADPVRAPRGN